MFRLPLIECLPRVKFSKYTHRDSFCLQPPKICHLFCKSSTIAQMQKYFLCRPQYVSTFQACIPLLTWQCCPCTSYENVLCTLKKTQEKQFLGFLLYGFPFWWLFFCARCMNVPPPKARPTIRARALTHSRTICKICAFNGGLSYTLLQKLRYWWNSSISKWHSEWKNSIHDWKNLTHNLCNSTRTPEEHWQDFQ